MRVLLASRSPRRAELLRAAGFDFEVVPADVDEAAHPGEDARAYVARMSASKAAAIGCRISGSPVLGADTVVVLDGVMLGKPRDDEDAARMLRMLAGRAHEVCTGVTIQAGGRALSEVVSTRVRFLPLTSDEIAWYVGTGEPRDKAGAYAIQGRASRFVESIEGSYSNVVGLPVATVYRLIRQLR